MQRGFQLVEATKSIAGARIHNRVNYQGITYAICSSCSEVIASGRVEAHLVAAERLHYCSSTDSEVKQEDAKRF